MENENKGLFNKVKGKAVNIIDRNNDGKFDKSDAAIIAKNVGGVMKKGAVALKDEIAEKERMLELKILAPVFPATLVEGDFLLPKFLRITERDKKHAESELCQGSIGYESNQKGLKYLNIFQESIDDFGLTFYPNTDYEFYYIDPSDRNRYIAMDEYFSYLKLMRINELQRIAQDLGAKHFKITYKEEKTSFSSKKVKAGIKVPKAGAEAEHSTTEKQYSTIELEAEMSFPGHDPINPALRYLQQDPSVLNLIEMRMNPDSPLQNHKFMVKLSNSSGITEKDGAKIDAVFKELKIEGNTTVASEAKNEARRYLEYEIEF